MKPQRTVLSLFAVLALVACGEGLWHTHDVFTRPTQAGGAAAVYFLLHNATSTDDALIGGETDVAASVEIHQSGLVDDLSGMLAGGEEHEHEGSEAQSMSELEMQDLANVGGMTHLDHLDIPAGHEVEFEPGSYHLMLIGLTRQLVTGDQFDLTLHFEHAVDLTIQVSVVAP